MIANDGQRRSLLIAACAVLTVGALLLSGCAGKASLPAATQARQTTVASPGTFTAETGAIEGLVTDDQLSPVAGAEVQLGQPAVQSTVSDASGAFSFSNLEPGSHIVFASKAGYTGSAHRVQVVAGSSVPAQLILASIPIEMPRQESFVDDGFIQLVVAVGAGFVNLGSQAALGTNKNEARRDAQPGNVETVATLKWDPSTAISAKWMYLDLVHDAAKENRSVGQSPLTKRVGNLTIDKTTPTIFRFMVSSPCVPARPNVECVDDFPTRLFQLVYEQRVKLYSTFFYIEPGPPGYTAAPDS